MLEYDIVYSTLQRSNAPTLIVEGRDDYVAFEEFEMENVSWGFTILAVSGRQSVERLISSAPTIDHPALAFLVDRDCSIFSGAPANLDRPDTFFTDGYAIENDLVRDGNIERLLSPLERPLFEVELSQMARFFACAAACHVNNAEGHPLSSSPHKVLGSDQRLLPDYEAWVEQHESDLPHPFQSVHNDPIRYIKGKVVVGLFTRHLSGKRRSKYSSANLLEIGSRARGPYMSRIEAEVLNFFRGLGVAPP